MNRIKIAVITAATVIAVPVAGGVNALAQHFGENGTTMPYVYDHTPSPVITEESAPENATASTEISALAAGLLPDSVYDRITPEMIELYEKEIAGEKFLSDAHPAKLVKLAGKLGVGLQKLKALMVLQDLAARTGENFKLTDLAAMGDADLIKTAKRCCKAYGDTLTDERKSELKAKFKAVL